MMALGKQNLYIQRKGPKNTILIYHFVSKQKPARTIIHKSLSLEIKANHYLGIEPIMWDIQQKFSCGSNPS